MKLYLKKTDILFYAAYIAYYLGLFVTYLSLDNDISSLLKKCLSLFACLFLAVNLIPVFFNGVTLTKNKIIIISLFVAIAAVSVMLKDFFIIVIYLFALNIFFRVNNIDILFKMSFILLLTLTISVIMLCMVGVLENVRTSRDGNVRYGMGFYHSNVLPLIIAYLCMYYHNYKRKVSILSFLAFEFFTLVVYLICNSRNSVLALQFFFILSFIAQKLKENKKYIKFLKMLCIIVVPLISVFSLALLYLYHNKSPVAIFLNDVFNNRIYMANLYFHYQKLKIINLITTDYYNVISLTLDNGYYYSIARYGVIFLLFIFAAVYYLTKRADKQGNICAFNIIIVVCAMNFIDNGFFSFLFYPFIISALFGFFHRNDFNDCNLAYVLNKLNIN